MKSSVDFSLRLEFSVSGCSIVVRYLDSWYRTTEGNNSSHWETRFVYVVSADHKVSVAGVLSSLVGSSVGCQWRLSS